MPGRQLPAPLPSLGLILGNPLRFVAADFGSYTLTGRDAATRRGPRSVIAAQGTYTLTGQAANTKKGRLVGAAQGTYTLTGQAATTRRSRAALICAQGTYTLAGQGAGTNYAPGVGRAGAPGPLPSIGLMLTPSPNKRLEADFGAYALTGQVVSLGTPVSYVMPAAFGSYTLIGSGALVDREMRADPGTYTLTGQAAILTPNPTRVMPANPGTYALTGQAALLNKTTRNNRVMLGNTGAYALTGRDAVLSRQSAKRVTAEWAAYTLAGQDVTLRKTARNLITATVANYQLRGFDVRLRYQTGAGNTFTDGVEDTLGKDAVNKSVTASPQANGKRYMDAADFSASPATIALASASYQVGELASVVVTARRTASGSGAVAVDWAVTVPEGAPSPAAGTFSWADGDTLDKSTTLTFGQVAQNRSATFTISNPRSTSGGPTPALGNPAQATISVFDTAAVSATAYDFNDCDAVYLTPGQTNVGASFSDLVERVTPSNFPSVVMVPVGADPRGPLAVAQTMIGNPQIVTAPSGFERCGYREFTVSRGSIPYGPVDLYWVNSDRSKISTPNRMWLVDPADLAANVSTTNVSGITALWAAPSEVKVPRQVRPATDPASLPIGSNYVIKSPLFDPQTNTLSLRAFRNETLFWQFVIEAGGADVQNVTVELDPFVDGVNGVTLDNPSRTAAEACLFYKANKRVHYNVYVPTYLTVRGASNFCVGTGGISSGTQGFNGWNEREGQLFFRRANGYDKANGSGNNFTPFAARPFANKDFPHQLFTPEQLPSGNGSFSIAANSSQMVYVDLWIPKVRPDNSATLPTGTYNSTFRVRVNGSVVKSIPITVAVQSPASNPTFALPDKPAVQIWGKLEQEGATTYGRMYGGLNKQYPLPTGDPQGAAFSQTLTNALRILRRYKVEAGSAVYPNPPGYRGPTDGVSNPAQFTGTLYTTTNGYAGPGEGAPDQYYLASWYSQWRYWSRANGGGGAYDMFRGGENPGTSFIDDISRAAQAVITCPFHGMEVGQYMFFSGGMTPGTPWDTLSNRHYKVLTVIDENRFVINANTSGFATSYVSAVGAGSAAFKDGPRPSKLWPACDNLATKMAAYPAVNWYVQIDDETYPDNFPYINAVIATFRDNPGVGKAVKTYLTQPLLRAYRGLQTPTGVIRIEGLHVMSVAGGPQSGLDVNPNELIAEWPVALAYFQSIGTEVVRYDAGLGNLFCSEDLGASHVAHTWSLWIDGCAFRMLWELRGYENFSFNYNFPNVQNHNRLFSNPFTFFKEDVVSTTMGRWASTNWHTNGDGSLILPGRDAIFNEPAAYGLDLVMPKPQLLHSSRGVEDATIFAEAAKLKGRSVVEAVVRRAMPRSGSEIGVYYQYNARRTGHMYMAWAPAMRQTVDAVRDLILS